MTARVIHQGQRSRLGVWDLLTLLGVLVVAAGVLWVVAGTVVSLRSPSLQPCPTGQWQVSGDDYGCQEEACTEHWEPIMRVLGEQETWERTDGYRPSLPAEETGDDR